MKKTYLMTAAMLAMTACATAQKVNEKAAEEFKSHMFLQVQGGAQYTLGEAKFGDLISPNVQVGLGYQFNPWLAARLTANAWQSKGGFNGVDLGNGIYGNATYKYKYVAPGIDVMFNLSNAIFGYNPKRVVNVSAFVGGGANIAFSNDEAANLHKAGYEMQYLWEGTKVRPVGRGGLAVDFRLCDAVSIGIEANANVLSDHYNSKNASSADWYFNALAGVKIALGSTKRKVQPVAVPVAQPITEPVEQPVVKEEPKPVEAPVEVKQPQALQHDVFFLINSYEVRESEMEKIAELAQYLAANPDMKIIINGYADAQTGSDAVNDRLSKQRAEAVAKILKDKHGIEANRIETAGNGSKVQPFAENDKNRVSVCVARQ